MAKVTEDYFQGSARNAERVLGWNRNNVDFIEKVRFEMAVELLQDGEIKLIEIAAELGYTDATNFTRAFKRWAGVSPREFRNLRDR